MFMSGYKFLMNMLGAALVGYFGYRTFISTTEYREQQEPQARLHQESLLAAFATNFFLTLANPLMFISLTAVLAISGATHMANDYYKATCLVSGIFLGSTIWWLVFTGAVGYWRAKITTARLQYINEFSGLVIMTYAAVIVVLTFYGLRST